MKSAKPLGWGIMVVSLLYLAVVSRAGPPGEARPIRSDGSLLNEGFDTPVIPAGWEIPDRGRGDVTFKDGRCTFNPGKGDNYLHMPALPIDLDEDFVIELSLGVPAPVSSTFSILTLNREGGEFQVLIVPAGAAQNVVMTASKPLGAMEPGKTYTLAVQVFPDGTYKGTLAGPGGGTSAVQTVNGVDGALHRILVGNGYGGAEGALTIDHIKVGRLAR